MGKKVQIYTVKPALADPCGDTQFPVVDPRFNRLVNLSKLFILELASFGSNHATNAKYGSSGCAWYTDTSVFDHGSSWSIMVHCRSWSTAVNFVRIILVYGDSFVTGQAWADCNIYVSSTLAREWLKVTLLVSLTQIQFNIKLCRLFTTRGNI